MLSEEDQKINAEIMEAMIINNGISFCHMLREDNVEHPNAEVMNKTGLTYNEALLYSYILNILHYLPNYKKAILMAIGDEHDGQKEL